jgi:hypothetical protein
MSRKPFVVVLGIIVFLFGLVWFLQGTGILLGSVMTGSQFWAVTGALMIVIGTTVILAGLWKFSPKARANKAS